MVEEQSNVIGSGINESNGESSGIETKRGKIRFRRATTADATTGIDNTSTTESKPRKPRSIPTEKRTTLTVEDRAIGSTSKKVKGKEPTPPAEEEAERKGIRKRGKDGKYKYYPTKEDAKIESDLLISGVEMMMVSVAGPVGEMTPWEQAMISGPFRRIIQRTPLHLIDKAGVIGDLAFLAIGGSVYFTRVFKMANINMPGKKSNPKGVQEDYRAPVAAPVNNTVESVKAGDLDGLAQPIPRVILENMNGAI